jgi:hypothetical protein
VPKREHTGGNRLAVLVANPSEQRSAGAPKGFNAACALDRIETFSQKHRRPFLIRNRRDLRRRSAERVASRSCLADLHQCRLMLAVAQLHQFIACRLQRVDFGYSKQRPQAFRCVASFDFENRRTRGKVVTQRHRALRAPDHARVEGEQPAVDIVDRSRCDGGNGRPLNRLDIGFSHRT